MPHDESMTQRARSFGAVAEHYERYRPTYPAELIDDVRVYAGVGPWTRVLDIGAGTGKATIALARADCEVIALEPAREMADVLRARADDAGVGHRVTVRVAPFEALSSRDGPFGLVIAAQSFHWTDTETRWQRLVSVLAPGAAAAMFSNRWVLDPARHDHAAIRRVYADHAPSLVADLDDVEEPDDWPGSELQDVSGLGDLEERSYTWSWQLPLEEYVGLLATTSQYAVLPDATRARLFESLRSALDSDLVSLRGRTVLHLMRRTGGGAPRLG